MIKHGVVMVTSLIIILSLLGVVSASDITASDVDMQSLNQEDTQIEIAQTSDTSTVESESDDSSSIGVDVDTTLSDSGDNGAEANIDNIVSSSSDDAEYVQSCSQANELSYEYGEDCSSGYSDGELLDCDVEGIISGSIECDFIPLDLNNGYLTNDVDYKLGFDVTTLVYELFNLESAEDILVITAADPVEIDDVTTENVLNGIMDASNGYVTYDKGNLITLSSLKSDLISIAFFIKKEESLTMAFYNNGAITSLCSGDESSEKSVNLWDKVVNSWINAFGKGAASDESPQHFLSGRFGQDMTQTFLGDNNRLGLSNKGLLGIQEDSDSDAFIWSMDNTPDKSAFFSADSIENESLIGLIMENTTSENGMITVMSYDQSNSDEILKVENNLDPDVDLAGGAQVKKSAATTLTDIKQIGVDAGIIAYNYFISRGIDVIKDYKHFYVFTSAGYATINGLNTERSIYGILEVLGPKVSKNMFLVYTPLWKDLIFYFIWVNGADSTDYVSFALKYISSEKDGLFVTCVKSREMQWLMNWDYMIKAISIRPLIIRIHIHAVSTALMLVHW